MYFDLGLVVDVFVGFFPSFGILWNSLDFFGFLWIYQIIWIILDSIKSKKIKIIKIIKIIPKIT